MNPGLPAVIVPVFNALEDLQGCLESLRRNTPPEAEVVLIDDASTDPRVLPLLRARASLSGARWRVEPQPVNRGFVATVNRGMQLTDGDVVLLNSDTIVTPGWLLGLQRCLDSDASIATATPWTNNGEIASLPRFCQVNPVPADVDAVAQVIRAARLDQPEAAYPDLPTAVGFCMAISRRAIDRLGLFDERLFGRGYGEENDFSLRASNAGMRNVLCDDVYVAHVGGRSFAPLGLAPGEDAMTRLLSRHPDYLVQVEAFIAADPLRERRTRLVSALQRLESPVRHTG